MRILAIRGANLASLAGEFEVDFERPPLDRAGLFAISGPTGSGKSTLLDALCLALFDRMPRLPEDRGHLVGRADEEDALRIRSTDVRAVLRRGAGGGWAEADFLGVDGRRYRARWDVWRARHRPDGRLQDSVASLTDLAAGQQVGGTKTETLELISQRLGLTFDQFRRSVLLAQGDFSAFLKAGGKERAELLERVTGTGLYAELSRAAYQRAVAETQELQQLEQRLGEVAPLDDDGRRGLEAELGEQRRGLEGAAQRRESARRAAGWHDRRDELISTVATAAEAVATARGRWDEAATRRRELEQVQRVQGLRRPLEQADEAAAEVERLRTGEADAAAAAAAAEDDALGRRADAEAAAAGLSRARAVEEAARPQLARARTLDAGLEAAGRRRAARESEAAAQAEREARASRRLEEVRGERDAALTRMTAAAEWLAERAYVEQVAAQWERWRGELERLVRARAELDAVVGELGAVAREGERLADEEARAGVAAERAASALRGAEATLAAARAAAAEGPDEAETRRRRRAAEERREHLREALELARRVVEERTELSSVIGEGAELVARAEADDAAREKVEGEGAGVRTALDEARRAYELAVAVSSDHVEALRSDLMAGVPCPVCGATDHPWRDGAPAAGLAAAQAERVGELEARVEALAAERGRLVARLGAAVERRMELARREEELKAAAAALSARWAERAGGLGLPVEAADESVAAVVARIGDADTGLAEVLAAEDESARLRAAVESAQARVETARAGHEAAADQLEQSAARRRELDGARVRAETGRAAAQGVVDEAVTVLDAPLAGVAGWRGAATEAPQGLIDELARAVQAWRERQAERSEAEAEVRELSVGEAAAAAAAEHARQALAEVTTAAEAARSEHEHLKGERRGLLEGRPVAEVEQELTGALGTAEAASDARRSAATAADQRLAVARRELERMRETLAAAQARAEATRSSLEASLARHGLDEGVLRQLLGHPQRWIEEEAATQAALERDLAERSAVATEQRRLLGAHETSGHPELDAAAARAAAGEAEAAWEVAHGRVATMEERLAEDDRRLSRAAALRRELATQSAKARVWGELRELIGSADGSKLRIFAQSLTLDVLLAHANRHLEQLARRYRLERVPGAELELQVVDRDLGDEVRSVHGLSGGETFLVSLALALGLASLSSRRTRVDSLFIDEGFGSLDADTLDTALASLDALQAQGRTVGVISHVPTMVERIGVQVKVFPRGGGRSGVVVLRDGSAPPQS